MAQSLRKRKYLSLSFKIIFIIALILTLSLSLTFYVMSKGYEQLLYSQIQSMARILFQQVLITRKWIADHGGVFIEKTPQIKPNVFLPNPVASDVIGKEYLMENPAYITRQLSQYARKEGVFWYRLTSLNLINPVNTPDEFEKNALKKFESDKEVKEVYAFQLIDKSNIFRYIAPVYVEKECMKCHEQHGCEVGDIRGALSITIPVDNVFKLIKNNRRNTIIAVLTILATTVVCLFFIMRVIVINPISRLTGIIRDYGKNKLVQKSTISSDGEIEELCSSFLTMAQELSNYHTTMDLKVQQATQNLHDMNDKLVEANKELEKINRDKSDLIASLSHELRTPLTSIKGALEYIHEIFKKVDTRCLESEDIEDFLKIIKKNAQRLINLVNDTIELEKIELGKIEMHINSVDLAYLIDDVTLGLMPLLRTKQLTFKVITEEKMIFCGDEDRIQQVLINLLSNAINFSHPGDVIEISSYRDNGQYYCTEVADKGPGVSEEAQSNIFQKYYKKGSHEGSGLGLAICQAIIDAHSGVIGVKQNKPEGSVFYFTLPVPKKKDEEKDISC